MAERSVCAGKLIPHDRLLVINGQPVEEKASAKTIIVRCRGVFQAVVERPNSTETIVAAIERENAYRFGDRYKESEFGNDTRIPEDVKLIMAMEINRRKSCSALPFLRSLLKTTSETQKTNIQFEKGHKEYEIASDVDPNKTLSRVFNHK